MALFLRTKNLSDRQQEEIQKGLSAGLTRRQISMYASASFTPEQMEQVRLGFMDGLSSSEVRKFADPSVKVEDMRRIRSIYKRMEHIQKGMKELDIQLRDAEQKSKAISKHLRQHINKLER